MPSTSNRKFGPSSSENQHFVQFASPGRMPTTSNLATGRNGFGQLDHPHAGILGTKNLAAVHLLEAANPRTHAAVERNPETGHARIVIVILPVFYCSRITGMTLPGCPRRFAVSAQAKRVSWGTRVGVGLYKYFLGTEFRSRRTN